MKRTILLIFCLLAIHIVKAQPGCPSPFDMNKSSNSKFQVGIGVGLTDVKGDSETSNSLGVGYYLNLDYKLTKGVFVGLRGQLGGFKVKRTNTDFRDMESKYTAFGAGFLFHPYEMFKGEDNGREWQSIGKDIVEAFYVGVDVMSVSNKIDFINRGNPINNLAYGPTTGVDINGNPIFKDKVSAVTLPTLNIGFAPALNKNRTGRGSASKGIFRLVLNMQFNFTNTDELDGYTPVDNNFNRINTENDGYNLYSLGVRYSF